MSSKCFYVFNRQHDCSNCGGDDPVATSSKRHESDGQARQYCAHGVPIGRTCSECAKERRR
jgi:hypothetical protein